MYYIKGQLHLEKGNCGFIGVMGLTCLITLVRFFYIEYLLFLYNFGCIDVSFYFL